MVVITLVKTVHIMVVQSLHVAMLDLPSTESTALSTI